MKARSSKRAKALAICNTVKQAVYDRDGGVCIWCGRRGYPEAHYIPRSKGGLGIEENILTLCRGCHDHYDHGSRFERECMREEFEKHLRGHYPDWDEEKLYYRRDSEC